MKKKWKLWALVLALGVLVGIGISFVVRGGLPATAGSQQQPAQVSSPTPATPETGFDLAWLLDNVENLNARLNAVTLEAYGETAYGMAFLDGRYAVWLPDGGEVAVFAEVAHGGGNHVIVYERANGSFYLSYFPWEITEVYPDGDGALRVGTTGTEQYVGYMAYTSNRSVKLHYRTGEMQAKNSYGMAHATYGTAEAEPREFALEAIEVEGQRAVFRFARTDETMGAPDAQPTPKIETTWWQNEEGNGNVVLITFGATQMPQDGVLETLRAMEGVQGTKASYLAEPAFTGTQLLVYTDSEILPSYNFRLVGDAEQSFYFDLS